MKICGGSLVSKTATATDKLRTYLSAQSVDGIPSSNIAMPDELQSHGLVEATPNGKAIWTATGSDVIGSNSSPSCTCIPH